MPSDTYNQGNLTDGHLGEEDYKQSRWIGFKQGKMRVVIDLKKHTILQSLATRFLHYRPAGIALPTSVNFYSSKNGKTFKKIKTVPIQASANDRHDCWIDLAWIDQCKIEGRYVKIVADQKEAHWIFCDEVLVNPIYK